MRISEAFAEYEGDKRLQGYSPYTLKAYAIQARLLVRTIGDAELTQVTTQMLKEYLAKDSERLKPASIGHRIRFVKSFFRWAQDEALITGNPAARIREPKLGVRVPKALTDDDVEEIRESCASPLEHALIEMIYSTGCRIGEIALMNRADIDLDSRAIVVLGKGDKQREVYFSIKSAVWLKRYLRTRTDDDPALFVTERRPYRRISIPHLRYVVKRVARRANVEVNVYPHRLRHTYATHLLNNGAPLEVIQSLLGHTKIETTKLYTNLSGARRREQYRKYF